MSESSKPANHVDQWLAFVRLYKDKRGSDAGPFNKAIPRTTNGDVKQLSDYWHNEYLLEVMRPLALDRDLASRKRWIEAKRTIDQQLAHADPNALYANNVWFWNDATSKLALYLQSRKAVPTRATLMAEAVDETIQEGIQAAKDVAGEAGKSLWASIKPIAVVAGVIGAITGAVILIPPIFRKE